MIICLVVNASFEVPPGPAATNCSLVGNWTSRNLPNTWATFLANGTIYGIAENLLINTPDNRCPFRGTYTLSKLDAWFVWNVDLVGCTHVGTSHEILDQLFCSFLSRTYASSELTIGNFTAGCFAAFNPTCTVLQYSAFNGGDLGAGFSDKWSLIDKNVPHSHPGKISKDPPICSIVGVSAKSRPNQFYPYFGYENTTIFITYNWDLTYTSSLVHSNHLNGAPDCSLSWAGSYTIGDRIESYPYVTLYPYTSTSVQTTTAAPGSYCSYSFRSIDPASCGFETTASNPTCYIVWDSFAFGDFCTTFKLIYTGSPLAAAGPSLTVTAHLPKHTHRPTGHNQAAGHDNGAGHNSHGKTSRHGTGHGGHGEGHHTGGNQHL